MTAATPTHSNTNTLVRAHTVTIRVNESALRGLGVGGCDGGSGEWPGATYNVHPVMVVAGMAETAQRLQHRRWRWSHYGKAGRGEGGGGGDSGAIVNLYHPSGK